MESVDDFELLSKDELIEQLRISLNQDSGIKLTFPGKATARRITRKVRPRVLKSIKKYSFGSLEEQSVNRVIEGDNLQALATLYKDRGRIDLILTDPPYNTGGDWRYNDSWDEDPNDEGIGDIVSADDRAKHTKWMKFMYPRLLLMKEMLKPSGVLAICIDQRELFRLGSMLDEVFGEGNRLAVINWQKSYAPKSDSEHVSTATEYVLVYAKDESLAKTGLEPRTPEMDSRYKAPDGDSRRWKAGDTAAQGGASHQGMVYGIQSPFTGRVIYPPLSSHWRTERKEMRRHLETWGVKYKEVLLDDANIRAEICGLNADSVRSGVKALMLSGDVEKAKVRVEKRLVEGPWGTVFFGKDGKGRPQRKQYLEDVKQGRVPMTYWADEDIDEPIALGAASWDHEESGHSQAGVNELSAVVGKGHGFDTVKPLKLFKKIIQIWCPQDGQVLDPFAGSGTTGQAVLELNESTGTDRSFVLIERGNPENKDAYAKSLTADRLRRVVKGDWANGKGSPLAGGFGFYVLTKQIDAQALLSMERTEMIDTVIASHFDGRGRGRSNLIQIPSKDCRYLVARNETNEGIYLVWDGSGEANIFDEDVYEACVAEGQSHGLEPVYHVYSRLNLFPTEGVHWCQIPDRILADFGLDETVHGGI